MRKDESGNCAAESYVIEMGVQENRICVIRWHTGWGKTCEPRHPWWCLPCVYFLFLIASGFQGSIGVEWCGVGRGEVFEKKKKKSSERINFKKKNEKKKIVQKKIGQKKNWTKK